MTRAVAIAAIGAALAFSACSGGEPKTVAATSPCPLLAQLAQVGETVAQAEVADPGRFNATLDAAVDTYVRTAQRLRSAVPLALRGDVDRLAAAAEQYRFDDAAAARAGIDRYERKECANDSSE